MADRIVTLPVYSHVRLTFDTNAKGHISAIYNVRNMLENSHVKS